MHDLLPPLHFESINKYWLAALFVTLVGSALSVVFSHVQQARQHRGSRLVSDLLARMQLAFLTYGFALFISAYVQADQKTLAPWFQGLGLLGVLLYGLDLWLGAPTSISKLHNAAEKCPSDLMEGCPHPLRAGIKMKLVGLPFLFFAVSFVLAAVLAMTIVEGKPSAAAVGTFVPSALEIGQLRAGGDAYRDAPAFIRDNLDKLDQERRTAKNPDFVVSVIESAPTASIYGHYCWTLSLAQDYQADFALSARAAYLVHAGLPRTFTELDFRGQGQPYVSIVADVPKSSSGDNVVIVMSIYAKSSTSKVLHEVSRMLQPEVNCR